MNDLIQFAPNVPQQLSLLETEGTILDGRFKDQVYYQLSDGRGMLLDTDTAAQLNLLGLAKGEPFSICKQWTGKPRDSQVFAVWLSPSSEKARAAAEDPEDLMEQLRLSIEMAQRPKSIPRKPPERVTAPPQMIRGTGTNGPAPQPQAMIATAPPSRSAGKIPANVAFGEILAFVTSGLKASGEQWNDAAKQDLVSTVYISSAKAGMIGPWERGK